MTGTLFSLEGRVAVVTGAAGLLGREHAYALGGAGADLALCDIDGAAARDLAQAVASSCKVRAFGASVDVTDASSLYSFRETILSVLGRIDVLVNNAASNDKFEDPVLAAELSRFETYPLSAWQLVMDVNVTGVFLASQVLGEPMTREGSGSIVNIASTYGVVAPDQALYRRPDGTQAFFVDNYSRRTPLGRMAAPSDYRGALVFLASDASLYMTGANLVVDGGFTSW